MYLLPENASKLPHIHEYRLNAEYKYALKSSPPTHVQIEGMKALMSQGNCLGIHTNSYKVIQHRELFERFKEYLMARLGKYSKNYEEKVMVSHNGARACVLWEFPELAYDITTPQGFSTRSKMIVYSKNSHDGSWAPTSASGMMDFFCENLEMGGEWLLFRGKHTSGFTIDKFLAPQVDWIQTFGEQRDRQIRHANTPCDIAKVREFILSLDDFSKVLTDDNGEPVSDRSEEGSAIERTPTRLGDRIETRYLKEAEYRGHNMFSLSSSLTYYATHDSEEFPHVKRKRALGGKVTEMQSLLTRSDQVRKIINTHPMFTEIKAAA